MEFRHPQFTRITINPAVCTGKPCIRGMRFPVSTLIGYLAGGMSREEILTDFPFLEAEDIADALAFAASTMEDTPLAQDSILCEYPADSIRL
ncbi:MAG TPA: DUF433 domain-containing protein [Saprospiraceae bacterium]|nr:DUF433 domain-containing protein [Saprospiraceae bacterium]